MRGCRLVSLVLLLLLLVPIMPGTPVPSARAATNTFANAGVITLNDMESTEEYYARATPYPSTIPVSGVTGSITDVNVTLHHINLPAFNGIQAAQLVGPGGQSVGLTYLYAIDQTSNDITLTFDDASPIEAGGSPLASGTYNPWGITSWGPGVGPFLAPAPAYPASADLSIFNGTNPNGTWSLFVINVNPLNQQLPGAITGGWSLSITTEATNTPPSVVVTGATDGTAYEFGTVPSAGCDAQDTEDGPSTPAATLSPVTGPLAGLGLGGQTATCSVTDSGGLSASAAASYTVVDTTAPLIATHGDETVEAASPAGASVNYTSPATSDAVDGNGTAECTPASGATFPLGATIVSCTATDTAGNPAAPTTFQVLVRDTTAPVIAAHADASAEATSAAGAVVSYSSPATSDAVDGPGVASCAPPSGSTFALGTTTVTCSATDAAGNAAAPTSFSVLVQDTTAPSLTVPADLSVPATGATGAVVSYSVTAEDLADPAPVVSCTPPSGSLFAIGPTTVSCTATDAAGNSQSASFTVRVHYTFSGFVQPLDNLPTLNTAKAGQTIPIKWRLTDATGAGIADPSSFISLTVSSRACDAGTSLDAVEEYAAGASGLQYLGNGYWQFNWKTPTSYAGSCKTLKLNLADTVGLSEAQLADLGRTAAVRFKN